MPKVRVNEQVTYQYDNDGNPSEVSNGGFDVVVSEEQAAALVAAGKGKIVEPKPLTEDDRIRVADVGRPTEVSHYVADADRNAVEVDKDGKPVEETREDKAVKSEKR